MLLYDDSDIHCISECLPLFLDNYMASLEKPGQRCRGCFE